MIRDCCSPNYSQVRPIYRRLLGVVLVWLILAVIGWVWSTYFLYICYPLQETDLNRFAIYTTSSGLLFVASSSVGGPNFSFFFLLGLLVLLLLVSYCRTWLTHPGRPPLAHADHSPSSIRPSPIVSNPTPSELHPKHHPSNQAYQAVPRLHRSPSAEERWCTKCELYKAPRVHHCSVCNECIADYDHHCIFVNNCIGRFNHKYFILFLFYATVSVAFVLATSAEPLQKLLNDVSQDIKLGRFLLHLSNRTRPKEKGG